MIGAMIIVFREVIEAGLIIGIVLAATRGVARRHFWVIGGVAAGILGSCIVAAFTGAIAQTFQGFGQEIMNATILGTAVVMLAWHNIWMAQHGRTLALEMNTAGREVREGKKPLFALSVVVGMAVLREGAEVVLFLYGASVSEGGTVSNLALGGGLGLVLGAAVSALTYFGLLNIPPRYLFSVTSWLITFLAAGMAAQAASFLQQAGVVEIFSDTAWDASHILSEKGALGLILHALAGYSDQPTYFQLFVYLATLVTIVVATRLFHKPRTA